MTEGFAELVTPVLRYIVTLQQGFDQGQHPPLAEVRAKALSLLGEAEQKATVSTQLTHDFQLGRATLVYWIDEALTTSNWEHAEDWKQSILEQDLYRERLRADRFFERARDAEALAGTDPLELAFLAVALGFRGQYAFEPARLKSWSERAYARIVSGSPQPERFLPDEPADANRAGLAPLPGKSVLLTVSIMASITALVTLAAFFLAVHLTV